MDLNVANELKKGFNDKEGIVICGYNWGVFDGLENSENESASKALKKWAFVSEYKYPYDEKIKKWFESWGYKLEKNDFHQCVIQTNWANTQSNNFDPKELNEQKQIENFLYHMKALKPRVLIFMGSNLINALAKQETLKEFEKIVGEQGEYKKTQKSGPGTNYVYFWEFKECKVVCFPHPSGARIKVGVIEKYKNEMQEIFKKFKEIKKIS